MPAHSPLRVFCSYSHRDEDALKQLRNHLSGLRRQGLIEDWHDREIPAGGDWDEEIRSNLETADLILLLVSSDFIASHYCMNIETARALEREREDSATVIPVFWRKCDISGLSFEYLQGVPNDMRWISLQDDQDSAWTEVAEGIRQIVVEEKHPYPPEALLLQNKGEKPPVSPRYSWRALPFAKGETEGIFLLRRPQSASRHRKLRVLLTVLLCLLIAAATWYYTRPQPLKAAETLLQQGEYQSARQHCQQATDSPAKTRCLRITSLMLEQRNPEQFYAEAENEPDRAYALTIMGEAETAREDYINAQKHYQRAIQLNPDIAQAYYGLGQALHQQGKAREALPWYEKAVDHAPNNRRFLHNLAASYAELDEFELAEAKYRALLNMDNSLLLAYAELVEVLRQQDKPEDAHELAQQAKQGLAQNTDWKDKPLNAQAWFVLRDGQTIFLERWEDKRRWLDSVFQ